MNSEFEACFSDICGKISTYSKRQSSLILEICEMANSRRLTLNSEDRTRLLFLRDTIQAILTYFSVADPSCSFKMVSFASSIIRQLAELEIVLERVCRLRTALTVNFDIFEHTLKMKLQEISSLFPLGKEIRPSEVIQDSTARNVWDSHFVGRYHVTFSEFVRMLMENKLVNMSDSEFFRFERYLRYFLDFPQEDMVSPYKWNWLIRTFGPCKDFYANFIRIATGKGFVGLMNRIQAYEILTLSHRSKVYLIRMSRTEPEYLAFSYRNSEGHIGHQINKDPESSLPIPVDLFIQTKFHNYEPVDRFVDIQRVLETENLHEYATFPRQYA